MKENKNNQAIRLDRLDSIPNRVEAKRQNVKTKEENKLEQEFISEMNKKKAHKQFDKKYLMKRKLFMIKKSILVIVKQVITFINQSWEFLFTWAFLITIGVLDFSVVSMILAFGVHYFLAELFENSRVMIHNTHRKR